MRVVGICGFSGSGKDTMANYLIKNYGFKKLSFASVLKDAVSFIFGWDRIMLEGLTPEHRKWRCTEDTWWSKELDIANFTPIFALQNIGTEIMRTHIHNDIWVLSIKRHLLKHVGTDNNFVITDCRFNNEINMLKEFNAQLFHIERNLPPWVTEIKHTLNFIHPKFIELHRSDKEWLRAVIMDNNTIRRIDNNYDLKFLGFMIEKLVDCGDSNKGNLCSYFPCYKLCDCFPTCTEMSDDDDVDEETNKGNTCSYFPCFQLCNCLCNCLYDCFSNCTEMSDDDD